MRKAFVIARREYKKYFATPSAYAVLFAVLLILGILFAFNFTAALLNQFVPGVDSVLGPLVFLFVFFVPAITMQLLSEEHRMGTIELMLTSPVKDWELVIGKWLGGFFFLATLVGITLVYPIVMNFMVSPGLDLGPILAGYLGTLLLGASMVAVGVCVSSFFSNQVASFFISLGILLALWIASGGSQAGLGANELIAYLDFRLHFTDNFIVGVIDIRDIVYYLSLTGLFLFIGSVVVETRRWR